MGPILKVKKMRSVWIYEGETMPDLTAFYGERTGLVNEGKADDVYLDVSKPFNTLPQNTGVWKYGPGKQTMRCSAYWLQRVMNSSIKSSWMPATLQGLIQGPVLFNDFINDLKDETKYGLSKFAHYKQLGREVSNTSGGCVAI